MEFNPKQVVKFLRDEVVRKVDLLGERYLEAGVPPSPQQMSELERVVADYKNLLTNRAITLDILSRMDARARSEQAPAPKTRGRPRKRAG